MLKKHITILLLLILGPRALWCMAAEEVADSHYSSYYKKLKYEASLAYTKWTASDNWWTKIEPLNLYLGALPLKNEGHLEAIKQLGITHILSMVEDFEMDEGWLNQPITKEEWQENGIETMQIPALDFYPLRQEEIEEGVEYLRQALKEGGIVYIHCKAGRGRSATIVIAYLIKYHGLSFEEALYFVKEQRPQINLNDYQKKAILQFFGEAPSDRNSSEDTLTHVLYEYFDNMNEISTGKFAKLLDDMLYYVIEGVSDPSLEIAPAALSNWLPSLAIQSTLERRNRYLAEFHGDQMAATMESIERNHNIYRRFKLMALNAVPLIGSPANLTWSLWYQLREITLIAAIHGHDINDPSVKMKILSCLVGGDLMKIPALGIKHAAKEVVHRMLVKMGIDYTGPIFIPAQLIFNYLTDNSAKVSAHAIEAFAGENSRPVRAEEYLNN